MDGHSGDNFRFSFIGDEIIDAAQLLKVDLLSRRWVHNAADAFRLREANGVIDGIERDFELHDDGVRFEQERGRGIDVFGRKRIVRAFDDNDAILAAGFDEDGSDAARYSFGDAHVGCVDALRLKIPDGCRAEEVAADLCDHGDGRSEEHTSEGLVGTLAAKAEVEFFAEDGFAGAGKYVIERGEVHVGAAYHGNEGLLRHVRSWSARANYIGRLPRSA